MAELSRLIYKQETDEIGKAAKGPTRKEILGKAQKGQTFIYQSSDNWELEISQHGIGV